MFESIYKRVENFCEQSINGCNTNLRDCDCPSEINLVHALKFATLEVHNFP